MARETRALPGRWQRGLGAAGGGTRPGSSIWPEVVGCSNKFLSSLVGPGRIRPYVEDRRKVGARPGKKEFEIPAKPQIPKRKISVDFGT